MKHPSRRAALQLAGAAGLMLAGPAARALSANPFPAQPIRIMYPFSPGGGMEVVLRTMAEHMQRTLGQPVIIDNRTGAGGSIAANATATAAPDGNTLFVGPVGIMAITPQLRKLPYDARKDLVPVAKLTEFNSTYTVANALPVKTLAEFIAYAKANPGKVTFASSGVGSQVHLAGEILQKNWGIQMTHVPYKGAADITTDLLAGRVDMSIDVTMLQYAKTGRARLLAVQYPKRLPEFPDVPTVAETGVPNPGTGGTWFGAFAPKGTPAPVIERLSTAFEAALKEPDVIARMQPYAMEPAYADPTAFRKQWEHDYAQYGKVIRDQNIKLEN